MDVIHLTALELETGLEHNRQSPRHEGRLDLIVRRPAVDQRETVDAGELDVSQGLVGDNWLARGGHRTGADADPECQITLMNSRVAALVAQTKDRWPLAGDQLFVDFDLSEENVPAGTQLAIGAEAVVEITPPLHTGCKKFVARYGRDAMKFVNSSLGKQLHLRGVNAKVVRGGAIRPGDSIRKKLT
ncbi:MAG TPA: hypothetical protein PKC18_17510 [Lacipirellulaceae bacterium]|nr:hypothetical protein [Lacipirellulaceae bacterium]